MHLHFECQVCNKMVKTHWVGDIWLDNGTTLFCPGCDGQTKVQLTLVAGRKSGPVVRVTGEFPKV